MLACHTYGTQPGQDNAGLYSNGTYVTITGQDNAGQSIQWDSTRPG
jgi:hypothetical protein